MVLTSANCAPTTAMNVWYRRRDSNPHYLVPKTSASSRLGYAGMVNLARFERATSTFAESRSHSTELQVLVSLAEGTGVEPASDERAVVFWTTALPVRLPFREN